ncbi:MAG: quinone-interacting membrane-bound oxidoreductase complex subunit QmoC [Acidobacteriota bacterium]|jgi:quinone-modifying oxidoreductase subunit QmoC
MADALMLRPDRELIREVTQNSGGELKKCFQCATCSSVCSLSTEARPFPRQQVLKAQWGMTDQLIGDPSIWLCHDCGDCTARCPRGARPSAVMDAIRMATIRRLAFPRFMGNMVGRQENGAIMFVLSALILLAIAILPAIRSEVRPLVFAQMFPKDRLEPLFFAVSAYVVLALTIGALRFVKALRASGADGPILPALVPVLIEIIRHRRFASCGAGHVRRWGHLLVLSGFLGLALMGTTVGIGSLLGLMDTPIPTLNPLKIFANLCALLLVIGVSLLFWNRITNPEKRAGSSYCDWYFLALVGSVGLTGFLSEMLRLAQNPDWMFSVYYIHLSLVLTLFLCTPYSKFVHFLYRTLAMAATWRENQSPGQALVGARGSEITSA